MAYLLPRTILVVIAWGVTCALIRRIWLRLERARSYTYVRRFPLN